MDTDNGKELTHSSGKSEKSEKSEKNSLLGVNQLSARTMKESVFLSYKSTTLNSPNISEKDFPTDSSLKPDWLNNPKEKPQIEHLENKLKPKQTRRLSHQLKLKNIEPNGVTSLAVIHSITEANEQSEHSQNTLPQIQTKNFISAQKSGFARPRIGINNVGPVRPLITEKIRVQSKDSTQKNDLQIINIAGIRNKNLKKEPMKLKKGRSREFKRHNTKDPSLTDDNLDAVFYNINWPETKSQEPKNPAHELFLKQINKVKKFNQQRSSTFRSTSIIGEMLPSIYDLAEELDDLKQYDGAAPTKLLDDSDFLDDQQRYEALRKKKIEKLSKKISQNFKRISSNKLDRASTSRSLKNQRSLSSPLKKLASIRSPRKFTYGENLEGYEEPVEDEIKFVVDIRHLKATPVVSKEFTSLSYEDVLPFQKENEMKRIEAEELRRIRETSLKLEYKVTRGDELKAEERTKTYYQSLSRAVMTVENSLTTKRCRKIRQEKQQEEVIKQTSDKEQDEAGFEQSLSKLNTSKTMKKKLGFTGNSGRNKNFVPTLNEEEDLTREKLKDFSEVLTRIKKEYEVEADIEKKENNDFQLPIEFKNIRVKLVLYKPLTFYSKKILKLFQS